MSCLLMNAKYSAQQLCLLAGFFAGVLPCAVAQLSHAPGCVVLQHPAPERLHPPMLTHQRLMLPMLKYFGRSYGPAEDTAIPGVPRAPQLPGGGVALVPCPSQTPRQQWPGLIHAEHNGKNNQINDNSKLLPPELFFLTNALPSFPVKCVCKRLNLFVSMTTKHCCLCQIFLFFFFFF